MKARIGHYDIVTELGRGGMGVVYKGHEAALNRYVAIKVLSPALAHDESIKERFLREARSMASLNDPHIIQIYFIGEDEGQPYFAMEFVEGESLSSFLKRERRMAPESAARAIMQTATGLASAHDKGVVHRDIKPGNLMLDLRGRIKIADFGIAMMNDLSRKLTSTGEFVGTPGYLSPEVCTGQTVDRRSDIFSLGIVLFELLAGRMPFTDESPLGLLLEVVRAEIPDVRQLNSEVDGELTRILQKMTAKDPANRYQDCHALAADLAAHPLVLGRPTIQSRPEISPAAATVIGMRTPLPGAAHLHASGSHSSAAQAAAPAPVPVSVAASSDARLATPPSARPSVLERQGSARSTPVWPIAAVLLLAALGASAYVFRDRIPGLASEPDASATAATATAAATAAMAVAANATATPVAPPAVAPPLPPVPAVAPPPTPPPAVDPSAATEATVATTIPATEDPGAVPAESMPVDETSQAAVDPAPPAAVPAIAEPAPDATRTRAPLQADQSQEPEELDALRRVADSRRGALAKAAPPRDPPAEARRPQGPPKVAVIAIGDPAVTGPAEQAIEDALIDSGLLLADEDMVPGLRQALQNGGNDLPRMFGALARASNVRAVTVIRAEPLGSTQLNYYGQSDTLYSVQLTVRSYDVQNRAPLSSGFRGKVDFTQLNAQQKTLEALDPQLDRVVGTMSQYRPRGGGG